MRGFDVVKMQSMSPKMLIFVYIRVEHLTPEMSRWYRWPTCGITTKIEVCV